jgi:hypothetical protein
MSDLTLPRDGSTAVDKNIKGKIDYAMSDNIWPKAQEFTSMREIRTVKILRTTRQPDNGKYKIDG